jgi:putative peptidoglycan lipid II flippase
LSTQTDKKSNISKFLIKHSFFTSLATLLSRISGFVRDIVTAILFGATAGYDAYVLAFRIPNLMRRLFAEGAFSQAFVPVFAEYTDQKSHKEIKLFLNKITGNLALILLIITILGMIFSPWLIKIFAPGFVNNPAKLQTAINMLRITFPYILFISLTALAAGVLNCYNQFIIPAFTPVLLNLSLIFSGLVLAKKFIIPEMSLAWGVLIAGVIQFFFQLPFLYKLKLLPKPTINWHDPGVKRILLLIVPAIFGAAIGQINILVDSIFASFLETGSITWLYYADRLMEFPLGMFGVSFATVILPQLSKSFSSKSKEQFSEILEWGIRSALLVGIPASMILLFIPEQIIVTLFLRGKFSYYDVLMSSRSLMAYSFSVVGIMLVKILSSGFYAKKDLRTPVKIGCGILILNIILNSILTRYLAHVGIALATSIVSIMHAIILFICLEKDLAKHNLHLKANYKLAINLSVATIFLALFLNFYPKEITDWVTWSLYYKIFKLTEIFTLAGAIYCGILWLLGVKLKNILVIG